MLACFQTRPGRSVCFWLLCECSLYVVRTSSLCRLTQRILVLCVTGRGVLLSVTWGCVLYSALWGVMSVREDLFEETFILLLVNHCSNVWMYEGYSKSFKTKSKKYFIYEIYKIIFLHSFHPIHNTSVSDVSIEKFQDGIFDWLKGFWCCVWLGGVCC